MGRQKTPGGDVRETKVCARCGREIEYRAKWARDWDRVKYCGEKCRRARSAVDYAPLILARLDQRARGLTICPSEVLAPEQKQDKAVMEEVRRAARRLAADGQIEIVQKGVVVDPSAFKGPIRLRRKIKDI